MDYLNALDYVHRIPRFVRPLGNEKLGGLLGLLGNPQNDLKFIHVAGTNGKGSVCAMTAEILKYAGYKTGLFTSPFIEVFNERIRINGEMIDNDTLADYITRVREVMENNDMQVSEFAFITAVAFLYFRDMQCDIVVLETGMGGRLDATNIITTPICCALTSISLDHTAYLGDTLEEIAKEKCGIIKEGVPVVTAPNEAVIDIIRAEAKKMKAPLVVAGRPAVKDNGISYLGFDFELGLRGEYQRENAAVAIEIIYASGVWTILDDLENGLKNVKWQARYEFITPDIIIDGGHNPDGVRMLKKSLIKEGRPITLVMGMCADKDYKECILDLAPVAEKVIATEVDFARALKAEDIKAVCDSVNVSCEVERDIKTAIEKAVETGNLVCICGSLYLAGEARGVFRENADHEKEG